MLREKYAPEVEIIYKMANDLQNEPQSVASSTRNQKKSSVAKMIIKVLSFSKADLIRHTKDKVSRSLNVIEWHLNAIRIKKLGTMHHHEQPHPPANQSTTSQLQPNRNMDVISTQLRQGLTNQHAYSPQSSTQQGVSRSQENLINSPCNDSSVGNALCSFQNSPARSMQQSPPNHALQTNMVASPNINSQFGLEQGSPSVLHHDGLGKLYNHMLSSQQKNPLPSTIVNTSVPTMSSLLTSSAINSSHVVNQRPKKQILHIEKMNQLIQKSRIEKNKQQMSVQKDFSFPQLMSNIQPVGYSPQSLRYSLPADHEKQSFCAENTVHLPKPPIPVEQSQATKSKYIPTGGSPETSPLSIQFDTPEISQQSQPFKRLTEVVKSMSSNTLCASLQDLNAVINLVDNIAGPTTSTDKVNRQISAAAFNSVSSFSTGTNFERWCGQAADMVSTETYGIKKHKIEQNRDILGEIRAINLQLIESWLDVDSHLPEDAARTGAGDGMIVRCSYTALGTLAESLRMQYSTSQTLPDFIVRWRVPADYPKSSPVLLDTLPGPWSEVLEDISEKLELKLNQSIRTIPQPISLKEIVRKWDACAREVFTEFAEEIVGKSLRSNLGTWEKCITTS